MDFRLRVAKQFQTFQSFLKFIMRKINVITQLKVKKAFSNVLIRLEILNFEGKKVFLELVLRTNFVFGQNLFALYCYNKIFQQKLDEMQSVLIASISHDLRTPITGITSTLETMDLTIYPAEFKEKHLILMNNSDYLLCLVNDILVYKQIRLNKELTMIYEEVNLRDHINIVVKLLK